MLSILDVPLQAVMGFTDLWKDEGMTTIDFGAFDYGGSGDYKEFGYVHEGREIVPLQNNLGDLYAEKRHLYNDATGDATGLTYNEIFETIETHNALNEGYKERKDFVESTGFDEFLRHLPEDFHEDDLHQLLNSINTEE